MAAPPRLKTLGAFSRWRPLPPHPDTGWESLLRKTLLLCFLEGSGWCRVANRAVRGQPPSPWWLCGWWEGEAGRRATLCLVDSVEFREGFPFDLAKEKSSLFSPAVGPVSPTAECAGSPPSTDPTTRLAKFNKKPHPQRACLTPGACALFPPVQPGGLSQRSFASWLLFLSFFFFFFFFPPRPQPSYLPKENREVTR